MEKQVKIILMNEGIDYDCELDNIDDVVNAVIEEYHRNDVSMCDLLETTSVEGLSIADVVRIYAKLHLISDGDRVVKIIKGYDDEQIDLSTW